MKDWPRRLGIAIRTIFRVVLGLRLPLSILLILSFAYSVPQIRELGGYPIAEAPQLFALSWIGAIIYFGCFTAAFLGHHHRALDPRANGGPVVQQILWLVAGAAAGGPLIFNAALWGQRQSVAVIALIVAGTLLIARVFIQVATRGIGAAGERATASRRETILLVVGLALFAFMTVLIIYHGVAFSRAVGSLALIYIFFAAVVLILSPIEYGSTRLAVPFYSLLVIVIFSSGYLGYGRDHLVRLLPNSDLSKQAKGRWTVGEAFSMWLRCRPGIDTYVSKNKPYPVFIVAAEGGGSYAAIHANKVLSQLQSENPQFAEHVFMTSGVSGGAIGTSMFSAAMSLVKPGDRPKTCDDPLPADESSKPLTQAQALQLSRTLVKADYLSPTVGAGLFPNSLQLFAPRAAPELDRARWLEFAFEQTWQQELKGASVTNVANPLDDDFFNFWRPAAAYPGLIVNVVDSKVGQPMILAPFERLEATVSGSEFSGLAQVVPTPVRPLLEYSDPVGHSIRLSTAVGMSARFPYFFGPAAIEPSAKSKAEHDIFLYVDGGYFDSSGMTAATLIYANLASLPAVAESARAAANAPTIPFQVILVGIGYFSQEFETSSSLLRRISFPLVSLNNTRGYRALVAQNLLDQSNITHVAFELAPDGYAFPLGLFVSSDTADRIERRVGEGGKCDRSMRDELLNQLPLLLLNTKDAGVKEDLVVKHNSCSLQVLGDVLAAP